MQHVQLTTGGLPLLIPLVNIIHHGTVMSDGGRGSLVFIGDRQFGVRESPAEIMTLIEAAQLDTRHGTGADIKRMASAVDFLVKMIREAQRSARTIGSPTYQLQEFGICQDIDQLATTAGRYLMQPAPHP